MPKLWDETIETHRHQVRRAIIDTTAALVGEQGLISVTMSQIAEATGIGRATLYKYFPDIEAILSAWHQRQIADHFAHLLEVRDRPGGARERLEAVLEAYALICLESRGHGNSELGAFLHRDEQVVLAERQLRSLIQSLLSDAVEAGDVRDDITVDELAGYCLHALSAARELTSPAAVQRLVSVTLSGLYEHGS